MKKEDPPIIVGESFGVSPDDLWDAITQLNQMTQWFFENIPDFKPEVGFKTSFIVESGNRQFNHLWEPSKEILTRLG